MNQNQDMDISIMQHHQNGKGQKKQQGDSVEARWQWHMDGGSLVGSWLLALGWLCCIGSGFGLLDCLFGF